MGRRRSVGKRDHTKQPREKRTIIHTDEWLLDLRSYLSDHGGEITGSQRALAGKLKMPERTFKQLVAAIKEGKVAGLSAVSGSGRKGSTTISEETISPLNGPTSKENDVDA